MKKILLIGLILLFLLPLQPTSSYTLSCVEIPGVEEAYTKYDGVIIGKVDKATRLWENNRVKVTVLKSYKGVDVTQITLTENSTWGATMGPSEVGEEYLFFLRQTDGKWENPLCAPTVKLADAAHMLEYLKDKEIPITEVDDNSTLWSVFLIGSIALVGVVILLFLRMRRKKTLV